MAPIAALKAMQFGQALERILHKIGEANPHNGPVYLLKIDLANRFYQISLRPLNIPKLRVTFPNLLHEPKLMAFPVTLPMGWKNLPPIFCTAMETIADIANHNI